MVNFFREFYPEMSKEAEPLNEFRRKDVLWSWDSNEEEAFEKIKNIISEKTLICYYQQEKPLYLPVDASDQGLGAALIQDRKPIAYSSRSLIPAEKNYAPIEKEMAAVVFGLTVFNDYTYGRFVHVISDHQPLRIIVNKSITSAPKRLQRMLLAIQQYAYDVSYEPGSKQVIADALSRAPDPERAPSRKEELLAECVNELEEVALAPRTKEMVIEASNCEEIKILKNIIEHGWPKYSKDVPTVIREYYPLRDELSTRGGMVFRGDRIVIPRNLRGFILERLHAAHTGLEGTLRRAGEAVYWPAIKRDIESTVTRCDSCQQFLPANQKQPLMQHPIPNYPYQRVGADLFELEGKNFLVVTDYFTNFFEVVELNTNTTAATVIKKMKCTFARYGIPETVIADGGPQFDNLEFRKWAKDWGFEVNLSSPGRPQSNGMAESSVKIAKTILKKCKASKTDPYLGLLEFRNTPSNAIGLSPAQRLFGRQTRSVVPVLKTKLEAEKDKETRNLLIESRRRQEKLYNKGSKELTKLCEGERVRVQPYGTWKTTQLGKVIK